jgi:hypothetical protein
MSDGVAAPESTVKVLSLRVCQRCFRCWPATTLTCPRCEGQATEPVRPLTAAGEGPAAGLAPLRKVIG